MSTTSKPTSNEKSSNSDDNQVSKSESTTAPIPYTTVTRGQKRFLLLILSLTMLASPLTATIYLPLLPLLAAHFRVSLQSINLTITIYIIFQAISPLLFATSSDTIGRRPIYIITYAIYTVASLGLALNKTSYPALLLLRALQSLGASAVLAVSYGVVADICVPSERGAMLGPMMGAANLAVCVGPVIGGWVALGSGSYHWVFWALLIFGTTILSLVGFLYPETARYLVGNGSIQPKGWSITWYSLLRNRIKAMSPSTNSSREIESGTLGQQNDQQYSGNRSFKIKFPNILDCLKILIWKDTAVILWMAASPYAVYYCVQTSIPSIYKDIYGFNELKTGLSYLPGGAGVVLGSYVNGKMMDINYTITAKKIGLAIDRVSGDDLDRFPIENARARGCWVLLSVYILSLSGYGWAVDRHVHESIPLILQFILAVLCTCFQQTFNALLVDIFPTNPSTAAAASNITRCVLSSAAVAIMQPLTDAIGRGWFFTLLTVLLVEAEGWQRILP